MLVRKGDMKQVGQHLAACEALFDRMGMSWWLEQAGRLKTEVG
jgi:hypothetical protein